MEECEKEWKSVRKSGRVERGKSGRELDIVDGSYVKFCLVSCVCVCV